MEQHQAQLDDIFQALADPTRRAVLGRLGSGPASVSELAQPFDMALPSFMKHIRALEQSGWIRTQKSGRVRTCSIEKQAAVAAEHWLEQQRQIWNQRADRLERFVTTEPNKDQQP